MLSADELIAQVRAYNPRSDSEMLRRAYAIGASSHAHQTRADKLTPYFTHPLEAAKILISLKLDDASIAAAMLHDVIEDTPTPESVIREACGPDVVRIVQGVTKVGKMADIRKKAQQEAKKLEAAQRAKPAPLLAPAAAAAAAAEAEAEDYARKRAKQQEQTESLRKLILAVADDARVLLVKLADRLHNMRTLGNLRPDKRERIARETLEIYAPLAGRMGVQNMRDELEDLCFRILNPVGRQSIIRRLALMRRDHGGGQRSAEQVIDMVSDSLTEALGRAWVTARVKGRMKRPYSIWRKLQEKKLDPDEEGFRQLSDVIAFRIVVLSVEDCYRALGAIHQRWHLVPGRFKDYISLPKSNGYRSLHTTVMMGDPDAPRRAEDSEQNTQRVEVQIRTEDMHELAETGVAAHWSYKDGVSNAERFKANAPQAWLADVADELDAENPQEGLAAARMELYHDRVFCFTPRGEVKRLPQGATLLDFAYAVHTDVGDTCVGGEVNGMRAPLGHVLRNGDVVEIRRSDNQRPERWWESIAKTGRARSGIRRALEAQDLAETAIRGERILRYTYRESGLDYDARDVDEAAARLQMGRQELLSEIARWDAKNAPSLMSARRLIALLHPGHMPRSVALREERVSDPARLRDAPPGAGRRGKLKLAECCKPVPGDKILALPHPEGGFIAHRRECPVVAADEENAEEWREAEWEPGEERFDDHVAALRVRVINATGALAEVCKILSDQGANIDDLRLMERKAAAYDFHVNIEVRSHRHLAAIIGALDSAEPVESVERVMEGEAALGVSAPRPASAPAPASST